MPRSPEGEQAIERLREEIRKLPAITSPDTWSRHRFQLRRDIFTKDPRTFLTWDVIAKTMSPPPYARFARTERRFLQAHGWTKWSRSVNATHQAYHLCRFETETGQRVCGFDFILEFGGGYGEMRRVVHEVGFRGRYVIFDVPELNALQKFYLSTVGNPPTLTLSDVDLVRTAIGSEPANARKLFVATWSFDETPLDLRARWTERLSDFDAFLIAYQRNFAGIDNAVFFSEWQRHFPRIHWQTHVIPQLKDSFYLFGVASSGCP